jgi:hypothetical protein
VAGNLCLGRLLLRQSDGFRQRKSKRVGLSVCKQRQYQQNGKDDLSFYHNYHCELFLRILLFFTAKYVPNMLKTGFQAIAVFGI